MKIVSRILLFTIISIQIILLMINPIYAKDNYIYVNTNKSISIKPKIINNKPYIPLRTALEAYGWEVTWNSANKSITCIREADKVIFTVNNRTAEINNVKTHINSSPIIISGVTYIESKLLATQFGIKVRWNKTDNFIVVSNDVYSNIAVKGNGNIIVAGNGIIVNIIEPYGIDTLNDMLDYADSMLAKNLVDDAVIQYKSILDNISLNEDPNIYAHIMNNLGNAYTLKSEIRNKVSNINYAISYYKQALEIYSSDANSLKYSIASINLGNAYNVLWEVSREEEHLKMALEYFSNASINDLSKNYILEYATLQNNIGITYFRLNQKNLSEESLLTALNIYNDYLNIYNFSETPLECASIHKKTGDIYKLLFSFSPSDLYIQSAIDSYKQALNVFTVESYPKEYAKLHQSLGDVFSIQLAKWNTDSFNKPYLAEYLSSNTFAQVNSIKLPSLVKPTLLELIKNEYTESLLIYTYEKYPIGYAYSNYLLAAVYSHLIINQNEKEYLSSALSAYNNSLKVYTEQDYPVLNSLINQKVNEMVNIN
ncbi:copper amine oxidase N-terminal domain-containing protein [Ruminiclostridium herbifermentans]|uniref:Copper amine oxidase N-terminal domain-containing protein n=1 Tax=Ruminiclostridium herbifermentans TaxID=2488810 RepID=A0A4V6ER15_9FIRM|nr:copper amine oxidase N-terminal domain-containing protein [Ruminiclostridium herbifermentans]QNU65465.1 copper amine oxidase N-terminal domain-containing protein [Ruminiclostridium herbifermentans]